MFRVYWDNGKEYGNYYSGFRVRGSHPHLSPHYPRKKKGSFLDKYKESHIPKRIKDPEH